MVRTDPAVLVAPPASSSPTQPIQPKTRENPCESRGEAGPPAVTPAPVRPAANVITPAATPRMSAALEKQPDEPKSRRKPGGLADRASKPEHGRHAANPSVAAAHAAAAAFCVGLSELVEAPKSTPSFPTPTAAPNDSASLLAGTALVPIGQRNGFTSR
jgi:hypothetical protein